MIIVWLVLFVQGLVCFIVGETLWFVNNAVSVSWIIVSISSVTFFLSLIRKKEDLRIIVLFLIYV